MGRQSEHGVSAVNRRLRAFLGFAQQLSHHHRRKAESAGEGAREGVIENGDESETGCEYQYQSRDYQYRCQYPSRAAFGIVRGMVPGAAVAEAELAASLARCLG